MTGSDPLKILFFSRDPGGTNQLVAVRDRLLFGQKSRREFLVPIVPDTAFFSIEILAKEYAIDVWRRLGVGCRDWADVSPRLFLEEVSPDLILTATSHVDDHSVQELWACAREMGIPSAAFLDSADHLSDRFVTSSGQQMFPDHIFVFDEGSVSELTGFGVASSKVHISGNLYADYLSGHNDPKAVRAIKSTWGCQEGETVILFASDYISEIGLAGFEDKITEFECLDYLINRLANQKMFEGLSGPFRLVIRLHPKDTPGKYDDYPAKSGPGLKILVSSEGLSQDAVCGADLVAGMRSALLREAEVFGIPALQLIPLVLNKDPQKSA
ncbi:hypothetical protein [Emcibacter sp.]|uniref:hypothetical protein n=1 Tax=Emcibacter sp. TaxID=1979954 RepID=UPI002AA7B5F2|nr:hypothetical protein [Emcibacter sp.]